MKERDNRIPIWQKYALTVEQAAEYFGIGTKKIRSLICINKDANWYMLNGERTLIKRKMFEDWLNDTQAI